MKRHGPDISRLQECAEYLLDHEAQDFETFCNEGNEIYSHIFSVAYIALHGEKDFLRYCIEMELLTEAQAKEYQNESAVD
jgi:hypothetical protein